MKKVAIVVDTLNGGGAEKVCLTLASAMQKLAVRTSLIVLKKHCDYSIPDSMQVHYMFDDSAVKLYKKNIQGVAAKKLAVMAEAVGGFDLVLSNLDGAHPVVKLANLRNTWYIVHNSIDEKLKWAMRLGPLKYLRQKSIFRNFNGENLIAVSDGLKTELQGSRKISPCQVLRIYNPLDTEEIQEKCLSSTPPIAEPYVIHVGRFARMKRHDVLFRAIKRLPENLKLVLLCDRSNKLSKAIARAGLTARVILPGFQQNPYPWIQHASALILCSEAEGFGMVLAEALFCGTAAVSTRCKHGPDEILSGDLAEYLVPVGDHVSLAAQIEHAIRTKPDVCGASILKEMSPERVARTYLGLIDEAESE